MGKLHTLRRAIRRDRKRWTGATAAYFNKQTGQWEPAHYWGCRAHRKFIKKALTSA